MFVLDQVWLRSTFEVAYQSTSLGAKNVVLRPPKRCFYDLYGTTIGHCLRGGGSYCSLSCKFFNCVVLMKDIHSAAAA